MKRQNGKAMGPVINNQVDKDDVQPGVLRARHGFAHVFGTDIIGILRGHTVVERREQLRAILANLPSDPSVIVTIGFTSGGLERLGVSGGLLELLPPEFLFGAATRRPLLGDPEPVADDDRFLDDPRLDLIAMIASVDDSKVQANVSMIKRFVEPCVTLPTYIRKDRSEHFGFRDGIGNPPLTGTDHVEPPANGVWIAETPTSGHWRPLQMGEIVFGEPNEAGVLPGAAITHDLLRHGSFLVWRKIEQNVNAFRSLAAALAVSSSDDDIDEAAARIIGRNADGSPLVPRPEAQGRALTKSERDDFTYLEPNTNGNATDHPVVPLQSHIRRTNPRATSGFGEIADRHKTTTRLVKRKEPIREYGSTHRILRRGMLWGDDSGDGPKGTLFRCYQTSISGQFEFIQRNWLNDANVFGQGRTREPLNGRACPVHGVIDPRAEELDQVADLTKHRTFQPPVRLGELTTPLATLYAFVPGLQAMAELLDGRFD